MKTYKKLELLQHFNCSTVRMSKNIDGKEQSNCYYNEVSNSYPATH